MRARAHAHTHTQRERVRVRVRAIVPPGDFGRESDHCYRSNILLIVRSWNNIGIRTSRNYTGAVDVFILQNIRYHIQQRGGTYKSNGNDKDGQRSAQYVLIICFFLLSHAFKQTTVGKPFINIRTTLQFIII